MRRSLEESKKESRGVTKTNVGDANEWRAKGALERLHHAIISGIDTYITDDLEEARKVFPDPLKLTEGPLLDGMRKVVTLYEEGKLLLSQVIKSTRVIKKASRYLTPLIQANETELKSAGTIVLAALRGDGHDIGKNIVAALLSCNNYRVIDLGVKCPCSKVLETAKEEKADLVGLSGLITQAQTEMVSVAVEMERLDFKIPLLIGGGVTSKEHTAVKIAPMYSQPVVHVSSAVKSLRVCFALLNEADKSQFINDLKEEYNDIRKSHYEQIKERKYLAIEEARERRLLLDWNEYIPRTPNFQGTKIFKEYPLQSLVPFIDWKSFFDVWELRGKHPHRGYPDLFNDPSVGDEAKRVFEDAQSMLNKIISEGSIKASGIVGLYPCNSRGDDILVYSPELGTSSDPIAVFHGLRQQEQKEDSVEPYLCMSDFVVPEESGKTDFIGVFAVSAGFGCAEVLSRFEDNLDDYSVIMTKILTERLAAAFAESLYLQVKTEWWGYDRENFESNLQLHSAPYKGLQAAPGYPIQPDSTEKLTMWNLLNIEEQVGISLNDSLSLEPPSSYCGFYFHNPQSYYFPVGKVAKDQVQDYSLRKQRSLTEMEKVLNFNLAYERPS